MHAYKDVGNSDNAGAVTEKPLPRNVVSMSLQVVGDWGERRLHGCRATQEQLPRAANTLTSSRGMGITQPEDVLRRRLTAMHYTLFFNIPLTFFGGGSFIKFFLTPGKSNLTFNQVSAPVNFSRYAGLAFLLCFSE